MARGKRNADADELNLVPIMNLVTILIPFLLMAAQFVSYAVIDSTLPAIGPPVPADEQDTDEPLSLKLFVTNKGYTVAGNSELLKVEGEGEGKELGQPVPCLIPDCQFTPRSEGGEGAEEAYDVASLRDLLNKLKDDHSEERTVVLVPEPDIPYEVLVLTMDATREDPESGSSEGVDSQCNGRCLFDMVVIAGGVAE